MHAIDREAGTDAPSGCGEIAKGAHGDTAIAERETDAHIAARLEDHPRQQVDLKGGGIGRRRGDAQGRRHKIRGGCHLKRIIPCKNRVITASVLFFGSCTVAAT